MSSSLSGGVEQNEFILKAFVFLLHTTLSLSVPGRELEGRIAGRWFLCLHCKGKVVLWKCILNKGMGPW